MKGAGNPIRILYLKNFRLLDTRIKKFDHSKPRSRLLISDENFFPARQFLKNYQNSGFVKMEKLNCNTQTAFISVKMFAFSSIQILEVRRRKKNVRSSKILIPSRIRDDCLCVCLWHLFIPSYSRSFWRFFNLYYSV